MKYFHLVTREFFSSFIIFAITGLLFIIHRLLTFNSTLHRSRDNERGMYTQTNTRDNLIYRKRILGFFLYGIIPLIMIKFILHEKVNEYGFSLGSSRLRPFIFIILSIVTLPILFISARKKRLYIHYPEVRNSLISLKAFILSSITYVLYYFGYEGLYRGFLLFGLKRHTGNLIAVLISMCFTSLTHIRTPMPVFIGSAVTGVLFPYIVIATGSIWAIFIFHSLIGIIMDYLCIRTYKRKMLVLYSSNSKEASRLIYNDQD